MEYTLESVESKIKAIVAKTLKVEAADLGSDTRLVEELGADSLDALTIAMDVDDEFGINVDDSELRRFNSCREIASAVLRHLESRAATAGKMSA
jgi:acyl carrier protein